MTGPRRVPLRRIGLCLDSRRVPLNAAERADRRGTVPYWGANGIVDHIDDYLFDEPLVLLGEDGAPFFEPGKDVAFSVSGRIWPNNHIHVLRVRQPNDLRFVTYSLNSFDYGTVISGSTRDKLTQEDLMSMEVPLPEASRQTAIADFLDRETARLDGLLAAKRRMIEVLLEQARSWSIRHVLGESDGTTCAASSSGFYGGVPTGWTETALRHLGCEVQTGPFGSQLHAAEYVEGGWPVVNPMNLIDGEIVATPTMTVTDTKREELARHVLRPGDIVFGRRGEMGRAGLVTSNQAGWLCGTGSLRLRITGRKLVPSYLKLLLGSPSARAFFELSSVGSTMDNLNSEIVLSFPTLVPPVEVQHEIVVEIERHRGLTDRTVSILIRQIELLVERRQAIIAAAVTGELDIAGVAA